MIELKSNGHIHGIVESCLQLLHEENFEKQIIASMDYSLLQRVKALTPVITTVFITLILYGDYYTLKDVDVFSIESAFLSRHVVGRVHLEQKEIYVWTVNKVNSALYGGRWYHHE